MTRFRLFLNSIKLTQLAEGIKPTFQILLYIVKMNDSHLRIMVVLKNE